MDREKLEKNIASNLTIDLDVEKFIEVTLLDIEKYANQRVIEELESRRDVLLKNKTLIRSSVDIAVMLDDLEVDIKKLKN